MLKVQARYLRHIQKKGPTGDCGSVVRRMVAGPDGVGEQVLFGSDVCSRKFDHWVDLSKLLLHNRNAFPGRREAGSRRPEFLLIDLRGAC